MSDDLSPGHAPQQRGEKLGRAVVITAGALALLVAIVFAADVAADLLVAVVSLVILVATIAVLVRADRLGRGLLGAGLAVIVLATGMFTIAFFRDRVDPPATAAPAAPPQIVLALPPWKQQGKPIRLTIKISSEDSLPQGAFLLNPTRAGADFYHGDIAVECETEGKDDSAANCTGQDKRTWIFAPINSHALVGTAIGDALSDPNACEETKGVNFEGEYLPMTAGRTYCLRERGDTTKLTGLRVVSYSTAQPLPTDLVIETVSWTR
jgi:hypothetical protein